MPRERVVLDLLRSGPALATQAKATFVGLLRRGPTVRELGAGVARIRRFGDERALEVALAGSREYFRTQGDGTDAGFVDALYGDFLHRDPTPAERDAALQALARRAPRAALARRLLEATESQELLIRSARKSAGGAPASPTDQDLRDLARPGGLMRVTARALASDAAFLKITRPDPSWRPPQVAGASASRPPGYPIAEGFNLNSGVQPLALSSDYLEGQFNGISAGDDDVPWIAAAGGLYTYDLNTGGLTLAYSAGGQDPPPTRWVSAIDADEAYALVETPGAPASPGILPLVPPGILHIVRGAATPLPALPGGDSPSQIEGAPDGTVWVLARSGNLYALASSGREWEPIATEGNILKQIGVGSADNLWALTTSGVVLRYTASGGFQPDPHLAGSTVDAIQATSDGAAWAYASGFTFMKPSFGVWKPVPVQSGLTAFSGPGLATFAAGTMNRAFVLGTTASSDFQVDLINVGVVDRQPVPFPAYQGEALSAYQALSLAATVGMDDDIRSFYGEQGEDFSSFLSNVQAARVAPSTIDQGIWDAVRGELVTELTEVGAVYARLTSIQLTNTQIQGINDGQLNAVGQIVGLIVNDVDSGSIVDVILTDLFEAVLGAVSSTGISAGFATLAALLSAGVSDAITAFQQQNNVGPDDAVPIEFSKLQETLDGIFASSIKTINDDLGAVCTDRGKLSAVAGKILSNAWPDPDTDDLVTPTTYAYNVYFYQSLLAVRWQVVHTLYGDYIRYPITQLLSQVPPYDIAQYPIGYEDGLPVEDVYLMNGLDGPVDLNRKDLGPYPTAALIADIQSIQPQVIDAFWRGDGGWKAIKRVEGTFG